MLTRNTQPLLPLVLYFTITPVLLDGGRLAAVDIVATYDVERSQPPSFDADASNLTGLVNSAVSIFEDIFEDDWTLNLAYTWGDLGNDGTLGVEITQATQAGKPTDARVRFNTNDAVAWFIDETPQDHSEYNLQQTLIADLSEQDRLNAFTGRPPDLKEVGYAGVRKSIEGTTDLFSVVLHEIGHALGLSGVVIDREVDDGDFDIPSQFLNGASVGVAPSTPADISHLAAPRTMMFPIIIEDIRRLPSATDILAIASAAGWHNIDLPRQDFLGGSVWRVAENWEGNSVPDSEDTAFLRHGGIVALEQHTRIDALTVADSTEMDLAANLSANHVVIADAMLTLAGGTLRAGALSLSDASTLTLSSFSVEPAIEVDTTLEIHGSLIIGEIANPMIGQQASVISAPKITGKFSTLFGVEVSDGVGVAVDYRTDRVIATVALAGDADLDGEVSFQDFLALAENFHGTGRVWRDGEFTGDGQVTFDDFLLLNQNFGKRAALSNTIASVTEPGTNGLLILSFAAVVLGLKKRRWPGSRFAASGLLRADASTLNRNLAVLRRRRMIRTGPVRGRRKSLSLSAEGTAILLRAMPLWEAAQTSLVKRFGKKRFQALIRDLGEITSLAAR